MRSGPKALIYRGAMFRISELAWVKVAPLSPLRWALRISLGVLGLAFMWAVASSKGTWVNIEGILGLLAVHVAWMMHGDVRLASTGDLEDSYEERGGSGDKPTFLNWVNALSTTENELKVGRPEGPYFHWLNLQRIAWARSSPMFELYGLLLIPVFMGYKWVIAQSEYLAKIPSQYALDLLVVLKFPGGTGLIGLLCLLIALLGLAVCLTSFRRAVEVRACGGLTDRLPMSAADQTQLFEALAGNRSQGETVSVKMPVKDKAPEPAKAPEPPPAVVPTALPE